MDLLLHPQTKKRLDDFLKQPVHALLLEGQPGSGKKSVAMFIAAKILEISQDKLPGHSFFLHIEPGNGTISIENIRSIQEFTKLKTIGKHPIRRAVLVENAQNMTLEAQNAFLKLLEEPPTDTIIILTAPHNQTLLPTIYSRVQRIQLKKIEKEKLMEYFNEHLHTEVERAYYMSNGQIGLMQALLKNDVEHPLVRGIEDAKMILSVPVYSRLTTIDQWAKNRDKLPDLLQALQMVCQAALVQAAEKGQKLQIQKTHHALEQIVAAEAALKHNPNIKLLLSDLMLNI